MQKPIRYYITKSGEEPTVRSVRVALGAEEPRVDPETSAAHVDSIAASRSAPAPAAKVTRRVRDAIRRRTVER